MHTRAGNTHSCPACIHYSSLDKLYVACRSRTETDEVTAHLRCSKATLRRLLEGFYFPNLPNILGNNFSICTSITGRLSSDSKIW